MLGQSTFQVPSAKAQAFAEKVESVTLDDKFKEEKVYVYEDTTTMASSRPASASASSSASPHTVPLLMSEEKERGVKNYKVIKDAEDFARVKAQSGITLQRLKEGVTLDSLTSEGVIIVSAVTVSVTSAAPVSRTTPEQKTINGGNGNNSIPNNWVDYVAAAVPPVAAVLSGSLLGVLGAEIPRGVMIATGAAPTMGQLLTTVPRAIYRDKGSPHKKETNDSLKRVGWTAGISLLTAGVVAVSAADSPIKHPGELYVKSTVHTAAILAATAGGITAAVGEQIGLRKRTMRMMLGS